jgi:hypothetical protein
MDEHKHKLNPPKDPRKEITINKGEGFTFDKLKDCFFYPVKGLEGIYLLCSKHDEILAVVTSGQPFMFEHDGLIWKVPNPEPGSEPFTINTPAPGGSPVQVGGDPVQFASGSWWNNDPTITTDDTGTFSAQSSGGADEDASASYAAAK